MPDKMIPLTVARLSRDLHCNSLSVLAKGHVIKMDMAVSGAGESVSGQPARDMQITVHLMQFTKTFCQPFVDRSGHLLCRVPRSSDTFADLVKRRLLTLGELPEGRSISDWKSGTDIGHGLCHR